MFDRSGLTHSARRLWWYMHVLYQNPFLIDRVCAFWRSFVLRHMSPLNLLVYSSHLPWRHPWLQHDWGVEYWGRDWRWTSTFLSWMAKFSISFFTEFMRFCWALFPVSFTISATVSCVNERTDCLSSSGNRAADFRSVACKSEHISPNLESCFCRRSSSSSRQFSNKSILEFRSFFFGNASHSSRCLFMDIVHSRKFSINGSPVFSDLVHLRKHNALCSWSCWALSPSADFISLISPLTAFLTASDRRASSLALYVSSSPL